MCESFQLKSLKLKLSVENIIKVKITLFVIMERICMMLDMLGCFCFEVTGLQDAGILVCFFKQGSAK